MIETIAETLIEYRFLGIFLLSIISNSIPFVGIPYLNFLVLITPFLELWELIVVAILSALGASLGKVVIYFLGRGIGYTLPEKSKENLFFFQQLLKKWGIFAIFLFAASPLPDDVLYIPLGMAQYRLYHYFIAVLCGKIVVTSYALFVGKVAMNVIEEVTRSFELSFVIFLIATTIFTIFVLKFDWKKFFEKR
ncbi:MAG: VTT domain-containing protein [Archaeoglobaceae archaeon]|nr:VTT domain-containing protein [Archaeoglobaceae archaeon]